MITYKDRTWCKSDCVNPNCFRNFTSNERAHAIKWWGGLNFPIRTQDFSKDCDDYLKEKPLE